MVPEKETLELIRLVNFNLCRDKTGKYKHMIE